MTFIDNKNNGRMVDAIRESLKDCREFSALTNDFSIFAFDALRRQLQKVERTRLLLSMSQLQHSSVPSADQLLGTDEELSLRNSLQAPGIAKACSDWLTSAEVRGVPAFVPNSIYLANGGSKPASVLQGSSPLTAAGLGIVASARYEMNNLFRGPDQVRGLESIFDNLWRDGRAVNDELLAELRKLYTPASPELLYFTILRALFHDNLEQLDEEKIVKSKTGIKETEIWKRLYRFQRDGVLGAIDKIERYNGCIIADSVGLGKTFEALAVIKYYELRNDRVLVLAPKRLRENWTLYTVNDKRNILAKDRFNYDVLNHTDLSRTRGKSGEINLESLNWGNYDLVVIDESHNFRNRPTPKDEGGTRYMRLMNDVIQSGVRTRVLLLSATPVNNRMNDLKNQVAFITAGSDTALSHSGLNSIEQTLRKAQAQFNQWADNEGPGRTAKALLEALGFDYFKLLDLLTIARSRKHIEKYYGLGDVGRFPRRNQPQNIRSEIDSSGHFPALRDVNRDIQRMNLAAYAPLKYVLPHKREEYSRKYDIETGKGQRWRQSDREANLVHLMRVNLLKRMESSIHSFTQTLDKLFRKIEGLLAQIDQHDNTEISELSIEDIDFDTSEFDHILVGEKIKVLLKDVDRIRWRQELEEDRELLAKILEAGQHVNPLRDEKLQRLKGVIEQKIRSPINPGNKKLIIFTHFADTAVYLYENLAEWGVGSLGVHSAVVTGGTGRNATTCPKVRNDQMSILTAFSPLSKERGIIDPTATHEIDILIATDCISEGQNLQDCDFLVNYDIHWNPVRIIQRFGRVDRLGSRNEAIQLVNFWPNLELDEYINLEARVSGRMVLLDISATGEENVIESNPKDQMNDLEYRKRQLQRLQNEVLDLEDLEGGISITDLTLNDFKMDLTSRLKTQDDTAPLPLGAHAVVLDEATLAEFDLGPGVFFCLKSVNEHVTVDTSYSLAPYFAVYVEENGTVSLHFQQTRRLLEALKRVSFDRYKPEEKALEQWARRTKSGKEMHLYQELLEKAVLAISGKAEEKGVESLFHRGGTAVSRDSFKGLDDFEVVAYLAVLSEESA